ncbi:hypothetical protein IWW36_001691 [Coemansia brasiliensis]|uniref:C2H2-type domain-containing protein n=1 Tax=Coemansia brasiliensis TaxID=2650707 RepID=A0A9W8IB76_9FUNG|nr:hypothetical protein IWW36_001691 [Coemansia brasiliensis]
MSYSCDNCNVHFDSKTWYSGHLQRTHSRSAKIDISSTPTIELDSEIDPVAKYRTWVYRFKSFIRRKIRS